MSHLRELYQEVIIDHGRHPRNFSAMSDANYCQQGFNPLCGDNIILYFLEKKGVIEKLSFEGCGCAISMASASLMTEVLKNKSLSEIEIIFSDFHRLITQGELSEKVGKLAALSGVFEFPARVKCATLAWHALKAALAGDKKIITTEENP